MARSVIVPKGSSVVRYVHVAPRSVTPAFIVSGLSRRNAISSSIASLERFEHRMQADEEVRHRVAAAQ